MFEKARTASSTRFAAARRAGRSFPKGKRQKSLKPSRKVLRRLQSIEALPSHQQQTVLKTIDTMLRGSEKRELSRRYLVDHGCFRGAMSAPFCRRIVAQRAANATVDSSALVESESR